MAKSETLDSGLITQNLRNKQIGRKIYFFNSVTSTNEVAKKFASSENHTGTVIIAETQTKGRGRHNRPWVSPPVTGLWFSIILHPQCPGENLGLLSMLASNALRKSILTTLKVEVQLKWPNDIFLNGKKISGILLESSFHGDALNYVILGIGINVNQVHDDFPAEFRASASSLFMECKQKAKREFLLIETLNQFEQDYIKFENGYFNFILSEWCEHCLHKDRNIELTTPNGENISGSFSGIDASGNLCLLTPGNQRFSLSSAEVRII